MTPTSRSTPRMCTKRPPLIHPIMGSASLICIGQASQPDFLPSWPWLSSSSSSLGAVFSRAEDSGNPGPVTQRCSATLSPVPATTPAPLPKSSQEHTRAPPLATSSARTLSSSTRPSVDPSPRPLSSFLPLPPPAGSLDVQPSMVTSPRLSTSTSLQLHRLPSLTTSARTQGPFNSSTRADP